MGPSPLVQELRAAVDALERLQERGLRRGQEEEARVALSRLWFRLDAARSFVGNVLDAPQGSPEQGESTEEEWRQWQLAMVAGQARLATDQIKERIALNSFAEKPRFLEIDPDAFADLTRDMAALAEAWRGVQLVDKLLVRDLYTIITVTRNMADWWEGKGNTERANEVRALHLELDRLFGECCLAW